MMKLLEIPRGSVGSGIAPWSTGREAVRRPGVWGTGLALMMLAYYAIPSRAQINPADARSGSLYVTGTGQVDVFTVPPNQYFVLTDLEWSTAMSDGDASPVTLNLYGGGTRWRARGNYATMGGTTREPLVIQSHFETGLVFSPGDIIRFESATQIPGRYYALNWSGYVVPTGSAAVGETEPSVHDGIKQNAPNPFNPQTRIDYALAAPGIADLRIFDSTGRVVRTLAEGRRESGEHSVVWDGTNDRGEDLPSGVYYYELETDHGRVSRKALMLR